MSGADQRVISIFAERRARPPGSPVRGMADSAPCADTGSMNPYTVTRIAPGQYEVDGKVYYSRQKAHAVARALNSQATA